MLAALQKRPFGLTILRPSLVYGPYDYKYIPRVSAKIVKGRMPVVGRGTNPAPVVLGEDVADLAILAAERAGGVRTSFGPPSGHAIRCAAFVCTSPVRLHECFQAPRLPRANLPQGRIAKTLEWMRRDKVAGWQDTGYA